MNAFNMLADMRHLIILDFRPQAEFDACHIRKSIRVDIDSYQEQVVSAMLNPKDSRFMSEYKGDDLKSLLMIFPNSDATRM